MKKIIDLKIPIPIDGCEGQYLKAIGTLKRDGTFCFQTSAGQVYSFPDNPGGRVAEALFLDHLCSFAQPHAKRG